MRLGPTLFLVLAFFFAEAQRQNAQYHYDVALEQIEREEYDSALYNLNRSIVLRRNADTYFARGNLYEYAGEDQRAIADFSSSIELRNGFTEAYFKRGELYLRNGIYTKAIEDFNYLLNQEQDENTQAIFFRVDQRGLEQIQVTTMIKMKASVQSLRSQAFQSIGEYDKAKDDINQAIEADSIADNLIIRALLLSETGDKDGAIKNLIWATQIDPSNEVAWFNLTVLDKNVEVPQDVSLNPSFGPMLSLRAMEEYESGNIDQAGRLLEEALHLEPQNTDLLLNSGRINLQEGKYKKARGKFLKALEIDETNFDAYYLTGNAFFRERKFQEAAAYYEQFLARDRSNGSVWFNAAMAYFKLGNDENACTYLQHSLDRGMTIAADELKKNCPTN